MKKLLLLFSIFQFSCLIAQELKILGTPVSVQKVDADVFLGFDGMENLYYIKNNVLFKKNKEELWQYKNFSLGRITKVDFQNSLKIMLFYENFNTIVLLDNQLSEIQKINFSENDVPIIATATGIASGNRLWIYNSLTQQIGLFDYLKNTSKSITPPFKGSIKYYESGFTTFQWIDDNLNWYSCDVFGKITTIGKVSDFDQIQFITSHKTIFLKDGKLNFLDINKNTIYPVKNIEKTLKSFFYKDQILSIFTNQEITNYKIITP